jgi:hypothetical protein
MGIGEWFSQNSFNLGSSIIAIIGLWFNAFAIRSDTKARQVGNLIAVTENHRQIWAEYSQSPDLWRVLDPTADLTKRPMTLREQFFARSVIFQLNSTYYARKNDLIIKLEGLRRDAFEFLSLPIPMATWNLIKDKQNDEFLAFVESCLNWK